MFWSPIPLNKSSQGFLVKDEVCLEVCSFLVGSGQPLPRLCLVERRFHVRKWGGVRKGDEELKVNIHSGSHITEMHITFWVQVLDLPKPVLLPLITNFSSKGISIYSNHF